MNAGHPAYLKTVVRI